MNALRINAGTELLGEMMAARSGTTVLLRKPAPAVRARVLALLPLAAALTFLLLRVPAVKDDSPSKIVTANGVSLMPGPGQTATIIPTSDPKITIIWISEGDSE